MNTNCLMLHPSGLIIAVNVLLALLALQQAAPTVGRHLNARDFYRETTTSTTEEPIQTEPNSESAQRADSSADYLNGEAEFEELLERLKQEAELTPIKEDRRNYLGDNADMEQILELINSSSGGSNEIGEQQQLAGIVQEETPAPTLVAAHQNHPVEDENSCAICLDTLDQTRNLVLECGHEFHADCLHRWHRHCGFLHTCPMCRRESSIQ